MHVRELTHADVPAALELANTRPYSNCFLISLLERNALTGIVGTFDNATLVGIASTGANCVTTDLTDEAASGRRTRSSRRRSTRER